MNFSRAIPTKNTFSFAPNPVGRDLAAELTVDEIKAILYSPKGRMVMQIHLDAEREKNKKIFHDNAIKTMQEKEDFLYQLIGTADFLTAVERLEQVFDKTGNEKIQKFTLASLRKAFAKITNGRKSWRQKYVEIEELEAELLKNADNSKKLSKKDVIRGFIDACSENCDGSLKVIESNHMREIADKIKDEYGRNVHCCTNPDVCTKLTLDLPSPWEDDSIFENMTAWEIYCLGTENADMANNVLTTVTWIETLSHECGFNNSKIKSLIQKANENMERYVAKENFIDEAIKTLRKYGYNFPKVFEDVAKRYLEYEYKRIDRFKWERR